MSEESVEICLPKLGESIVGATVVQWFKQEGDEIAEDEPLLEVATDKVNSEIPSPVAGRLQKILAPVDAQIEVGAPLALVAKGAAGGRRPASPSAVPHEATAKAHEATSGFLSPAVLRLVRERGIPLEELDRIKGTGQGGRLTKRDIETYAVARGSQRPPVAEEGVERIPLTPMRRAIAENMVASFYTAPHGYLVTEVDVTGLMATVKRQREDFAAQHGVKLTLTSYLVQAIAEAVRTHPMINATFNSEAILVKKSVNIGVAVAVDDGLIVPVIKECQQLDLAGIATALDDIAKRTRSHKLSPDEVTGGSITLTNFGMSGTLIGLPIIRHPEVAIFGVGAIQKKPIVMDNEEIKVRSIVHATLSFDHRVVDGMYASTALQAFKTALEQVR